MATKMQTTQSLAVANSDGRINVKPRAQEDVKNAVLSFLDTATTATGRSTYYNSKEEQIEALNAVHDAVFTTNRGLYAAMLTLPGVNDLSVQVGIDKLLKDSFGHDESLITSEQEHKVISHLAEQLTVPRLLKMFVKLRKNRVNNARSRKLILNSILGSKNLAYWSVKYRKKLKQALTHAWGVATATFVRETLSVTASRRTARAKRELAKLIDKYVSSDNRLTQKEVYQCVSFILGGTIRRYTVPLLKQYVQAQSDLSKGSDLPREVLEGIRSVYHPRTDPAVVLELTKHTMTANDKLAVQRSAKKAGVKVDLDPTKQDIVKLYVYALEMGMTREIRKALDEKAKKIANTYPAHYGHIGIVLDTSGSMSGSNQQKNRPMAIALAMRDVLACTATEDAFVATTGGETDRYGMVHPSGETELAEALLEVLEQEPDVVYMITDGYENAPAGRVHETIGRLREIGIETPIYQITPVMAAEAVGKKGAVRQLSSMVSPMPVSSPTAIGMGMVRAAIDNDLEVGLESLMGFARPLLED